MDAQNLLRQGISLHDAGRLAEAERCYLQVLGQQPTHLPAQHLLGMLRFQAGRKAEALALMEGVVRHAPALPAAHADYGLVLLALSRFTEALASFDRALSLKPDYPEALYNRGSALFHLQREDDALESYAGALAARPRYPEALCARGVVLQQLGRLSDALASLDDALAIAPRYADALYNRGNVLRELGRPADAVASFESVLSLRPDFAEAWNNRGAILLKLERPEEALASLDRALALRPDFAEAINNRALVLRQQNRLEEALAGFNKTLAIRPKHADTLNERGITLLRLRRFQSALESFEAALAVNPQHAGALGNRGLALRDLQRYGEALDSFDRALVAHPDFAEALHNRANLLWNSLGRHEDAMPDLEHLLAIAPDFDFAEGDLLHLRLYCGDWHSFADDTARIDAGVKAGRRVVEPATYCAISQLPQDLLDCSNIYAGNLAPVIAMPDVPRHPASKIRIGYLCGEFRQHATSCLMAGLYECHDRNKFDIIGFDSGHSDNSPLRRRLEAGLDGLVDISALSDREAAMCIREKRIDILVNLSGYFGVQRMGVFAARPAPVAVNYLGFPGSLGAPCIDYIIADRCVILPEEERYYSEKVVCLPDSYQANDARRPIAPDRPSRAACGLPETGFVFCFFNHSYKLTPTTFSLWMGILRQVPGSVLWLLEGVAAFARNLRAEAQRQGVAGERLIFAPHIPPDAHLARLALGDLFLDSLPYNAHTTASDALWAGLPLLTCRGTAFAGRVAASLLYAIGLPELVTHSPEDYGALAVKLAGDPAQLNAIRQKLAHNRTRAPLFDTGRFARHIESAFATMWNIRKQGEAPRSFCVEPGA